MPSIRIESKNVTVNGQDTGYNHAYLLLDDNDVADDNDVQIRGGDGADGAIAIQAGLTIENSADARRGASPDYRGDRIVSSAGADDQWSIMRQAASEIAAAHIPYTFPGGSVAVANSNSVVATLLHTIGYDIADVLPTNASMAELTGSETILDFARDLSGTAGDDMIVGWHQADMLSGGAGSDMLDGDTGDDVLAGGSGNDTLTGGSGNDVFAGSYAELSGDRITDLSAGDRIHVTDATVDGFTFDLQRAYLSIAQDGDYEHGAGISLSLPVADHFAVAADPAGGVDLLVVPDTATADFDGDGHSDILFRNDDGSLSTWRFTSTGAQDTVRQNAYFASAPTSWHAQETFDMTGDGRSDILWRNDNGALSVWTATQTGFDQGSFNESVATSWKIAAVADIDGDHRDDILFRNDDGSLSTWLSTGTGFRENSYYHASVGTDWKVAGMADFDGDGRADILFRNDDGAVSIWTGTIVSGYTQSGQAAGPTPSFGPPRVPGFTENSFFQTVGNQWHVAGTGDFDGDGKADILWRNDDGALTVWRSNGSNFDEGTRDADVSIDWHVVQVGDLDVDGRSDILFRNDDGALSAWHSDGTGFTQNTFFDTSVPTSWHVDAHHFEADAFVG